MKMHPESELKMMTTKQLNAALAEAEAFIEDNEAGKNLTDMQAKFAAIYINKIKKLLP